MSDFIFSFLALVWAILALLAFVCSIAPAAKGDYAQASYFVALSIALDVGAKGWAKK